MNDNLQALAIATVIAVIVILAFFAFAEATTIYRWHWNEETKMFDIIEWEYMKPNELFFDIYKPYETKPDLTTSSFQWGFGPTWLKEESVPAVPSVPIPSTIISLATGLAGLVAWRRKTR